MATTSTTALLAAKLEIVRKGKIAAQKTVDDLSAEEQRIGLALEVVRAVEAEHGGRATAAAPDSRLGPGVLVRAAVSNSSAEEKPKTVVQMTLAVLKAESGLSAREVAERVVAATGTKRETVLSTLSRLKGEGMARREGKLYFFNPFAMPSAAQE